MSFWDNVKKFAQPYADDEYDDYDDDEYVDEYEEPEEPVRRSPRRAPAAPAPVEEEEDDFGFESMAPVAPVTTSAAPARDFGGKVLNMSSGNKQDVVLFRPNSFNDTSKAADDLKNRKAVIVNMENVDKAMARRVVDFLSGCAYALNGTVKKVSQATYVFCPYNMEILGDLKNLQGEVENYV